MIIAIYFIFFFQIILLYLPALVMRGRMYALV